MFHFSKKTIKKNTCRYHYQNLDDMIYSSWDIEQNILKLIILGHFLHYPPMDPKFWKKFTNVYHKWQSYNVWFLRYQDFFILDHFLPFYPPKTLKSQNFEKMKKKYGDIIILHKSTKNYYHMLHHSWDMARDRCNF